MRQTSATLNLHRKNSRWLTVCILTLILLGVPLGAQQKTAETPDEPNVRPPVTNIDLRIARRARQILNSPAKWNRADDRQCRAAAKKISLYCALAIATQEITGSLNHRGAALQEARFVIDEITVGRNYDHRLMDYNNDPTTTFSDIRQVLSVTESLVALRLRTEVPGHRTGP